MRTFALAVALLALATGLTRADDVDPEPPGGAAILRALKGKWTSVRRIAKGSEKKFTQISYTFGKDKVELSTNKGAVQRTMSLKVDKKRPNVIEMTSKEINVKTPKYFFKIEKGELYLAPLLSTDANPTPDFTGMKTAVLVLKKAD